LDVGLRGYVLRRIVYMIILVWAVVTVNFLIFKLMPGSPMDAYVAKVQKLSQQQYNQLKAYFGLSQPLHIQYLISCEHLITFNFGMSYNHGPVLQAIEVALPNTLILMGISTVITILVGMLLGVLVAYKHGGALDGTLVTASLITFSVPIFFLGWLMIAFFALYLKWFPMGLLQPISWSWNPPKNVFEYIFGRLDHLVLPTLTLVLFSVGGWILLTRAVVLETINEDYVLTAKAKGLKERTILYRHVLKNASLPLVTNVALAFGGLIGGAMITETLFSYEGMGLLTYNAVMGGTGADLPLLEAIFYILALCVIIANFIADLLYGVLDPRIKYG
jgi:peptide/nickel transport system permease protein